MTYTNNRGNVVMTRPMGQLSMEEREQVLRDLVAVGSRLTREKWNLSNQTMSHLRYYYKDLLEKIEDEAFARHGL